MNKYAFCLADASGHGDQLTPLGQDPKPQLMLSSAASCNQLFSLHNHLSSFHIQLFLFIVLVNCISDVLPRQLFFFP
jgi:hypothetical protein